MTVAAEEDITASFNAALAQDAGVPGTPAAEEEAPAPPPKAEPAAKPAPKPRPSKAAKADAKPRTEPAAEVKGAGDYTAGLISTGEQVWFAASMVRGGKLGPIAVPDMRAYAAVFHSTIPQMAAAWNQAAQQNATIRGYVGKLAGEGGVSWVIGVTIATAGLVSACVSLASAPAEVRQQLAESNDAALDAYVASMIEAAGLAPAGEAQAA